MGFEEGKGEVGGGVGSHQWSGEVGLSVEVGRIAKAWILLLLSSFVSSIAPVVSAGFITLPFFPFPMQLWLFRTPAYDIPQ